MASMSGSLFFLLTGWSAPSSKAFSISRLTLCNHRLLGYPVTGLGYLNKVAHSADLAKLQREVIFLGLSAFSSDETALQEQRYSNATYMLCQSKGEVDVVLVTRLQPKRARDVNWSSRARLVLQTTRICLYFATVDLDLGLGRK